MQKQTDPFLVPCYLSITIQSGCLPPKSYLVFVAPRQGPRILTSTNILVAQNDEQIHSVP
jgi:hypothetical protein